MNYKITHTVQDKGYDCDPRTLTVEVGGDTLRVDDQGYLFVEYIREDKKGNKHKTVSAVFKDWESAVPVPVPHSSYTESISSDAKKEPGKLILNKENSMGPKGGGKKPTIEVKKPSQGKEPDTGGE